MEKWPEHLLLLRHGQSQANVAKETAKRNGQEPAWTGALRDQDSPLTDLGGRQALAVGQELASHYPVSDTYQSHPVCRPPMLQYILTSPYIRARQTTEAVIRGLQYQPQVVVEERLREIDFGIMDGIDRETFRQLFPSEANRRQRDGKYFYRPPGGENRPDVRLRVHSVLDTLNRDYVGTRVLIVCHSVVVLAFRSLLERWGEEEYMQVDREDDVKNCGLTVYVRHNQRRLQLQEYNLTVEPQERVLL